MNTTRTIERVWFAIAMAVGLALLPFARARAEAGRRAFAVVIGNNHSLGDRRPDLHYADDDAAKYYEIMRTIAPERVTLLADFDADTARLFAATRAHARAPTRAALLDVQAELAEQLRAASAEGHATDLYFVFAGHGDIDEGTGFIELADARFTATDLEAFLRAAHADRAHVILDSCNSFFMLGARRPGGRYYATAADAVRALSARLPNVGVFLSTSAEGDAFEWSEIQSGVFSHVVRSGLLGAADANNDGFVDYLELAGFVSTATAEVANPNLRPHVFARGPAGRDDVPIVALHGREATRTLSLADPSSARVRLLNRDALPLLDTHTEAGAPVSLAIPNGWLEGAEIERGTSSIELLTLPAPPFELALASLPVVAARGSARGPDKIFQKLFMQPFGPKALAVYATQLKAAKPEVYGVSREDSERMTLLLDQISNAERGQRLMEGWAALGATAFYGFFAASTFGSRDELKGADVATGVMAGAAAASLGAGIYTLLTSRTGERLYSDYRAALNKGDYAAAFALANDRLRDVAASEAQTRWGAGIGAGVLVASSGLAWFLTESQADNAGEQLTARTFGGTGVLLGLTMFARLLFVESPVERLVTIWQRATPAVCSCNLSFKPCQVVQPSASAVGSNHALTVELRTRDLSAKVRDTARDESRRNDRYRFSPGLCSCRARDGADTWAEYALHGVALHQSGPARRVDLIDRRLTGFAVYAVLAACGITALLIAVPLAYDGLRFAGAAYLAWLAWKAFRPGGSPFAPQQLPRDSSVKLYAMGLLTNLLNPKIAVLYLSLFPQFVDPARGDVLQQSLALAGTQIAISASVNALIVVTAGTIATFIAAHPSWSRIQRWLMGTVLGLLALRMAADSRR